MTDFDAARHLIADIEILHDAIRPGWINVDYIRHRMAMLSGGEQILARLALGLYLGTHEGPSLREARGGLDDINFEKVVDALAMARRAVV